MMIDQIADARSLASLDKSTREDIARETWLYLRFAGDPVEDPQALPDDIREMREKYNLTTDPLWDYISREAVYCAGPRLQTKFRRITKGLRVLRHAREDNPDDEPVLKGLAKCADRSDAALGRKRGRAFPIAASTMRDVAKNNTSTTSPAVIQAIAFGLTTFGTVSRAGEVMELTRDDVKWHRGYAVVRLRATKTRTNIVKMLPRTDDRVCPTRWLRRHLQGLPPGPGPLCCGIGQVTGVLTTNAW